MIEPYPDTQPVCHQGVTVVDAYPGRRAGQSEYVVRTVFADQFPKGADLRQAARDSLIRYCRQFGLRHDPLAVWVISGTKWRVCRGIPGWCKPDGHMHQVHPMVESARASVEAWPR